MLGMLLLNALLPKWDHVATMYLHGKTDHTMIDYTTVRNAVVAEYDRTSASAGTSQHVHKISAIKRKGEHPSFKQQMGANQHKAESSGWPNSDKKKARKSKNKVKGCAYVAEHSPSPNPFTNQRVLHTQRLLLRVPRTLPEDLRLLDQILSNQRELC